MPKIYTGIGIGIGMGGQGALLNQIPFKSDALVWLDGTISGTNFVDKISGKLFPITGKDFDASWTRGFPYKSSATISAPSGDAVLIAADLNSYWYTAETPNQIPVVSLFQDVDYEHKVFCRHLPQMVDANGVEIFQPRVADIVIYNTVKSGADLVNCQVQFNVPIEDLTTYWVSKIGLDTNAGTKALPWKTIQKVDTSGTAGKTAYIKTGIYLENDGNSRLRYNKNMTYIAIGSVEVNADSVDRLTYFSAGNINVNGIVFNARGINGSPTTEGTTFLKSAIYNKCIFKNGRVNWWSGDPTATVTLNNCIAYGNASGISNTYISSIKSSYLNTTISNCRTLSSLSNNKTINTSFSVLDNSALTLIGNYISNSGSFIGGSFSLNAIYNKIFKTAGSTSNLIAVGDLTNQYASILNNNTFKSLSGASGAFALINTTDLTALNNVMDASLGDVLCLTTATNIDISNKTKINNNWFKSNSAAGIVSINGERNITTLKGVEFARNTIIGHRKDNPNATSGAHGVFITTGGNANIHHNLISYGHLGMIVKCGDGLPFTSGGVYANMFKDNYNDIYCRGVGAINISNNTISRSSYVYGDGNGVCISCDENSAAAGIQNSENCLIKNNIFDIKKLNTTLVMFDQWAVDHGCVAQNNVFNGGSILLMAGAANYASLATAQAAGKLLGCVVSDPLLDANLIPATPLLIGENLGVNYEDGLDITTNWGNDTTLPVIVTKKQPTTGNWQAGTYIK